MGIIDTHCHLNDETYQENVAEVVQQCLDQGIEKMICIGFDLPSSRKAVEIAHTYPCVYAAVGIHPDSAEDYNEEVAAELEQLAEDEKVVAIGEIGLDYYWDKAPRDMQKEVFKAQIELARRHDLPIIIHSRDALMDTYDITANYTPVKGVMHCYSGSAEMAAEFIKQGFHISLAGPVTFKNARVPKEVAVAVPSDKLLVETDCPYLTPHPYRGKVNYPYYVKLVAEEIARLRGIEYQELEAITSKNACDLFSL
ncbi:MAG: TatD family hydrolase [Erysipelotrichales bacterium]|nr:TatD family hydrolase [Erysipelotrichales bacterium]MBR3693663.1 TatD family hydrolase [Erysipelotrichales bacterium]